jgi:iron-sulfur cluster assembly accessory protein
MTVAETDIVQLTEAAADEVKRLLAKEPPGRHLRLYVEKGGCSGLQYGMVFDERREGDLVSEQSGLPVLVDAFSAKFLQGTVVDFDESLTGGGFKLRNPNARQSCGCGHSFEV